jgi:hypothetical protein
MFSSKSLNSWPERTRLGSSGISALSGVVTRALGHVARALGHVARALGHVARALGHVAPVRAPRYSTLSPHPEKGLASPHTEKGPIDCFSGQLFYDSYSDPVFSTFVWGTVIKNAIT